MKGHGSKFGRKKDAALMALLLHPSVPDAAGAAEIGTSTLLRWMQIPEFKAAFPKGAQRGRLPGYCTPAAEFSGSRCNDPEDYGGFQHAGFVPPACG